MTIHESLTATASGMAARLTRLRDELKANKRAGLGLLLVSALIGGYGLLTLDDAIDAEVGRQVEAAHRLERLVALGNEKEWPQRATASEEMRKALEARLWHAENDGIARADLQDWVTNQGRDAGLDKLRVSVDSTKPAGAPDNYRAITATIGALYTEAAITNFIDRIQREPRMLVVDHFQAHDKPVASLEMKLIAYTVIGNDRQPAK